MALPRYETATNTLKREARAVGVRKCGALFAGEIPSDRMDNLVSKIDSPGRPLRANDWFRLAVLKPDWFVEGMLTLAHTSWGMRVATHDRLWYVISLTGELPECTATLAQVVFSLYTTVIGLAVRNYSLTIHYVS